MNLKITQKSILTVIITIICCVVLIGGISFLTWYIIKSKNEQKDVNEPFIDEWDKEKELDLVENTDFPSELASKVIAENMGYKWPITRNYNSQVDIRRKINEQVISEVKEKYPSKMLSGKILKAMEKYAPAKPGKTVKFSFRQAGRKFIEGTFKERKDNTIYIDDKVYSFYDVSKDYRHLFDNKISTVKTKKSVNKIKTGFKKKVDDFMNKRRVELEEEFFPKEGYYRDDYGEWLDGEEYHRFLLGKAEEVFNYVNEN